MSMGHFISGVRRGRGMRGCVCLIFKILGKSQTQHKGEREAKDTDWTEFLR